MKLDKLGLGELQVNDVVQFTENHKWCGCLGIIVRETQLDEDVKYMVGVPIPQQGTAYINTLKSEKEIEYIGEAVMIEDRN